MLTATLTQTVVLLQSRDLAIAKLYCDQVGFVNNYGKPLSKGQIVFSIFKSFVESEAKPYMRQVKLKEQEALRKKELGVDTLGILTETKIETGDKNGR